MNAGAIARVSLKEQIACIKREIQLRERVYPRWIEANKLSRTKADIELECMRAVLQTLERLENIK